MQYNSGGQASESSPSSSTSAPERPLPSNHFCSVEFPGYVQPGSVPQAIRTLGGQGSLDAAFRRNAPKQDSLLELNFRPDNPFSHPVPGDIVPTNNILLRVVKRKRRRLNPDGTTETVGEYTASAVGVIPKTARFRSRYLGDDYAYVGTCAHFIGIADFQFQPNMNDPVSKLRIGMEKLDGEP